MFKQFIVWVSLLFSLTANAQSLPLHIVAAENFYGEVAKEIGGQYVDVTSIISNPNQDPHLFSANVATAKSIAKANLIIYNGLNYDPWMEKLIASNAKQNENIIVVANLITKKAGENPHIWYGPAVMGIYAKVLTERLSALDPIHQSYYAAHWVTFNQTYEALLSRIEKMKNHYQHVPVIATEPLFNDMALALGLRMFGDKFQVSIMNETSPSAQSVKDFEDNLRTHQVKVLIYNNQVSNPLTKQMQMIANESHIPVVGVSETQPLHQDYVRWMSTQLEALDKALSHARD